MTRPHVVALALLLGLAGCGKDKEAQKLYEEASQILLKAQVVSDESYAQAYELTNQAHEKLKRIMSQYGSTDIAEKLTNGEARIGGSTWEDFKRTVVDRVKQKAEAETSPFALSVLVAETINLPSGKEKAMDEIIRLLADTGQYDGAISLASSLDVFHKAMALAELSGHAANAGQFDRARTISESIPLETFRTQALAELGTALAKAGKKPDAQKILSAAIEAAEKIDVPASKVDMQILVALGLGRAGETEKAASILAAASNTVNQANVGWSKAEVLARIAGAYAESGLFDQATVLARSIGKPEPEGDVLAKLALNHAGKGNLDKALEVTARIEHVPSRLSTLNQLAVWCAETGRLADALRVIGIIVRQEASAGKVMASLYKDKTIPVVADAFAKERQFDQALTLIRAIERPGFRASALVKVADRYAAAGQGDDASVLLHQAREAANEIKDTTTKTEVLDELALAFVKTGAIEKGLELIKALQKPELEAKALAGMGVKTAESGDKGKASEILSRALEAARTISYESGKAVALAEIGASYARAGISPNEPAKKSLHQMIKDIKP